MCSSLWPFPPPRATVNQKQRPIENSIHPSIHPSHACLLNYYFVLGIHLRAAILAAGEKKEKKKSWSHGAYILVGSDRYETKYVDIK